MNCNYIRYIYLLLIQSYVSAYLTLTQYYVWLDVETEMFVYNW